MIHFKLKKTTYSSEHKRGFTLIEALVAIFILSASITALMTVVSQSIFNSTYIKNKAVGISLAQEGVELVRNIQDSALLVSDYASFDDLGTDMFQACMFNDTTCTIDPLSLSVETCPGQECPPIRISDTGYFNYTFGEVSPFTRSIKMASTGPDSGYVKVTVSWMQGSIYREVIYGSDLFLWIE